MSANPGFSKGINDQFAASADGPSTAGPIEEAACAERFTKALCTLVKQKDTCVLQFIHVYELRSKIPWLEEADPERGLENALLKAVSGFPAGNNSALGTLSPSFQDECTKNWRRWEKRLSSATHRMADEYPHYLKLVNRIQVETQLSEDEVIRRLLIGYVSAPNHGLATEAW